MDRVKPIADIKKAENVLIELKQEKEDLLKQLTID